MSNVRGFVKTAFVGTALDQECASMQRTDAGNVQRMLARFGDEIRYVVDTGQWLTWEKNKWVTSDDNRILYIASETNRLIYNEVECFPHKLDRERHDRFADASNNVARITALIKLVKAVPSIQIKLADIDGNDSLLATKNGYLINLHSNQVRPLLKSDLITKVVNADYDESAISESWEKLVNTVFDGDCDVIDYFQTLAGYSITGLTNEELMVVLHGDGSNGKSTIQDTLKHIMGDYSAALESESILRQKHARHSSEIAVLAGKRFVTTAELGVGRQLNEERIKTLTSGDPIQVRYMCRNPFDMQSKLKLWVSTNNLPIVDYSDNAIWRRIKLIKFNHVFNQNTGINKTMRNKLKSEKEKSGILNWLISGAYKYYTQGLIEPETVTNDTQEWRFELNIVSRFISDECVTDKSKRILSSELYGAFNRYLKENGELSEAMSHKAFSKELKKNGYQSKHTMHGNAWLGLALRDVQSEQENDDRHDQYEGFSVTSEKSERANYFEPSENPSYPSSKQPGLSEKVYVKQGVLSNDGFSESMTVDLGQAGDRLDTKPSEKASCVVVSAVHVSITVDESEYRTLAKRLAADLPAYTDSKTIDALITKEIRKALGLK